MVRLIGILLLCLSLVVLVPAPPAFAQGAEAQNSTRGGGPRKQITVIIFAGLAGAILGLSTLSFYGRPQDKLANIPVGAAVGIIVGATYSTYRAASEGRSFYDNPPPDARWKNPNPELWQLAEIQKPSESLVPLSTALQFSF